MARPAAQRREMVIIRPRGCKLFVKVLYYRVTESRSMKPVQASAGNRSWHEFMSREDASD